MNRTLSSDRDDFIDEAAAIRELALKGTRVETAGAAIAPILREVDPIPVIGYRVLNVMRREWLSG